jgi:hypothetical protein
VSDFVGDTVSQRVQGEDPSRIRAFIAAIIIGIGAAVLAYKLLRKASSDGDDDDE